MDEDPEPGNDTAPAEPAALSAEERDPDPWIPYETGRRLRGLGRLGRDDEDAERPE